MIAATPQFVLLSETDREGSANQWRFLLASADGRQRLSAADSEPNVEGERLELLSVVRGLEALDQPSRVTLLTGSRYVSQGLNHGLPEWRENGWRWERFGELVPVKHRDLWQRVDRALKFHEVECRTWRCDGPHRVSRPHHAAHQEAATATNCSAPRDDAGAGRRRVAALTA